MDAGSDSGPSELDRVPAETADEEALAALAAGMLPTRRTGLVSLVQQSSTDRLMDEGPFPTALLEQGNRDMNHFVCIGEGSSVGEGLVRHVTDLERCPEPWVRGAVLARVEGSGAMVRLWATLLSLRGGHRGRQRLRVYVDDEHEPRIDVPLTGVLDGSAGDIFAPPFGAGARDRVAWYYPVVFAFRLVVSMDGIAPLDMVYHQTLFALDDTGARRAGESPSPMRALARAALTEPGAALGTPREERLELSPGEPREVVIAGPALLRELAVSARPEALSSLHVRVWWDGASEPAIDGPLLDVLAAGLDPPPADGLWLSSRELGDGDRELALRIPAPFAAEARIALSAEVRASATLRVSSTELPRGVDPELRLHAFLSDTREPQEVHPLIRTTGRGRVIGTCLVMQGQGEAELGAFADPHNFLEGDERVVIDGRAALLGTGTEDFLDGAFYFEAGTTTRAFAQAWAVRAESETEGRASGCRWHLGPGALELATSIDAELEVGGAAPETLRRYRSVVFAHLAR